MSSEAHIGQLTEKHRQLEEALQFEMQRPAPDDIKIHDLKKQKLIIKDEIARLSTQDG